MSLEDVLIIFDLTIDLVGAPVVGDAGLKNFRFGRTRSIFRTPFRFCDPKPQMRILEPERREWIVGPRSRYFVMKSSSHKNIVLSVEHQVWATPRNNQEKLNEAFQSASHVILVFSVAWQTGLGGLEVLHLTFWRGSNTPKPPPG